jgi:hypothetical protein
VIVIPGRERPRTIFAERHDCGYFLDLAAYENAAFNEWSDPLSGMRVLDCPCCGAALPNPAEAGL